jgi:hypothetical protein
MGGGAGKATFNLAGELARMGHQVSVLTSKLKNQPPVEKLDGFTGYRVMSWRKGDTEPVLSKSLKTSSFFSTTAIFLLCGKSCFYAGKRVMKPHTTSCACLNLTYKPIPAIHQVGKSKFLLPK